MSQISKIQIVQNNQPIISNRKKSQWRNSFDFPADIDFIEMMFQDSFGLEKIENNQNLKKQKQKQNDWKKYNYMPSIAVKAFQEIADEIWFHNIVNYGLDFEMNEKVEKVFFKIVNQVLLNNKNKRRNKRFLTMIFNDVDDKLNSTIKKGRLTEAEQNYFEFVEKYGKTIMNLVKKQLRAAFERVLTEIWIESFAYRQNRFRENVEEKKKNLFDYLMELREQLRKGKISGSVDGKRVKKVLPFKMEEQDC